MTEGQQQEDIARLGGRRRGFNPQRNKQLRWQSVPIRKCDLMARAGKLVRMSGLAARAGIVKALGVLANAAENSGSVFGDPYSS